MIGTRLGPYEITAKLGEGGMGEVYRATDTKLKREVAIKVLPAAFTEDKERLARFEREAQLLAQLNHPNIAAIHGLEESDGVRALILELVEGPTLAERLESGPLSLNESLSVSLQIAQALEEAHEKEIIHRDLKPQNVKASMEGKVKVLDFGLAKAMDPAGAASSGGASASQLAASPTLTLGATQMGMILGTAAYMAPEQARGIAVDKRADIWAFGVVLYEMLTGRRLFAGELVTDVLANVINREIDLEALPASTPPAIRRLLRRCLERNPKNRLHDIADARIELTDSATGEDRPVIVDGGRRPALAPLPWVVASIAPPAGASFLAGRGLAISPDGPQVVFGVRDEAGMNRLWLRSLRDGSARAIDGTENGKNPFWSPDSRAVGFFDDQHLKRVTLSDGVVETYHDTTDTRSGGAWSPQGVIVFGSSRNLFRMPAGGGEVRTIPIALSGSAEGTPESLNLELLHPAFLPDGSHFLFLARDYSDSEAERELRVGSLEGGPSKLVMRVNSNAVYAPSGDLLWWQGGHLRAQAFDVERLELTGAPRLLRKDVQFDPRNGLGVFSVAADGTLVYREGGVVSGDQLALVDRGGKDLGPIGLPGNFYHPRISPDGTMVAVDQSDETNRGDIWIYDLERRTGTRWTSHPVDESNPVWSPDGRQLAFLSARQVARGAIHARLLRGSDDEKLLFATPDGILSPLSWSVHGAIAAVHWVSGPMGRSYDLGVFSIVDETFVPNAASRFNEQNGCFSPDGRFLAFDSDGTGRREVYVQPYPNAGDRWRVSTEGGSGPFWRADGHELYFLDSRSQLSVVTVRAAPDAQTVSFGDPKALFAIELKSNWNRQIDTIDGRTFVVNRTVSGVETTPLTLVVNTLSRDFR